MSTLTQSWIATNDGMHSRGRTTRPLGSRESLVYGTYKPDVSTTGVLPGIARTNFNDASVTGTVTLSTAGATYENLNFYGDVIISAANITFRNCWFWGGVGHPPSNRGSVSALGTGNHNGLELYDCTITARSPSYYRDGIVGNSYSLFRCNIYGTNDGAGAFSSTTGSGNCDVAIYGSYIHDLVWWRQDPAHTDGTHNDCIQFQGGSNFISNGNALECYLTTAEDSTEINTRTAPNGKSYGGSALIINQNTHAASGVVLTNNWLSGGYSQIQLNRGSTFEPLTVELGQNRYGRDIYENYPPNSDKRWLCLTPNSGTINATHVYDMQIWEDTGELLVVGRATGIRSI